MLVKPITKSMKYYVINPTDVYKALKEQTKAKYSYLLESCEGDAKSSRYSFLGVNPIGRISIKNGNTKLSGDSFSKIDKNLDDPIDVMKSSMGKIDVINSEKKPRFIGGAVGYFSYDLIRYYLPYLENKESDLDAPDCEFIYTKDIVAFDHINRELELVSCAMGEDESELNDDIDSAKNRLDNIEDIVLSAEQIDPKFSTPKSLESEVDTSKNEYMNMVKRSKEYIKEGDIFQVVISKKNIIDAQTPFDTYIALKNCNPSPYMYFLEFGDLNITGSSPEMLVRAEKRKVTTRPIAGTRKRGKTEREDINLAKDMLDDPKERAEHIMLVDLHRNDLGRVCRYGTVNTTDLMSVEKFSHVQHIVSTVEGEIYPKYSSFDSLRSIFPAGTVSGAPKVRAMEIINELENQKRGPYAGSVGYFGLDGNLDFAITIRTLIQKNKKAYIQAGAGIVADSVPEKEWIESENKAAAMMRALSVVD